MTGGLVGFSYSSRVSLCSVEGTISGVRIVGGLAGHALGTRISQCAANASVSGEITGGLIGDSKECAIEECTAIGQLENSRIEGGLIGKSYSSHISNCCSRCDLIADYEPRFVAVGLPNNRRYGGFIGISNYDVAKMCYSAGHVAYSDPTTDS